MCRLFAYVHSGSPTSLRTALGDPTVDEFQRLAEVHQDGWGAAWLQTGALSTYLSTQRATQDALFAVLADQPVNAALIHERWASPGIGLELDNQQPFTFQGVAFAHNGTIGNTEGNIVDRPSSYRESLGLVSATRSDSRLYAELFFLHLRQRGTGEAGALGPTVDQVHHALSQTIARLRQDYPDASFNAAIQTTGATFLAQAHPAQPRYSEGLRRGYEKARWADRIDTYYDLHYTTLIHTDGSVTVAATSSGYSASDPWTKLGNDRLLVLSHQDAQVQVLPLD